MLTIVATLGMDFFRALFVRYTNSWWCFDLEKQFPQYGLSKYDIIIYIYT